MKQRIKTFNIAGVNCTLAACIFFLITISCKGNPIPKASGEKNTEKAGIHFVEWGLKEVAFQAKASHRPYMVFITAPYCGESRRMQYVFKSKEVYTFMNKNFLCDKFNTTSTLNNFKAVDMGVTGLPAFCFFDYNGKLLLKEEGYKNREAFMAMTKHAYDALHSAEKDKLSKRPRPRKPDLVIYHIDNTGTFSQK